MIFTLSDRWGEADPRKIAELPAYILTYWEAYFSLLKEESGNESDITGTQSKPAATSHVSVLDDGFADCMRILGNG